VGAGVDAMVRSALGWVEGRGVDCVGVLLGGGVRGGGLAGDVVRDLDKGKYGLGNGGQVVWRFEKGFAVDFVRGCMWINGGKGEL